MTQGSETILTSALYNWGKGAEIDDFRDYSAGGRHFVYCN